MKETGFEWLGEIPTHWEVKPLGALLRERIEKNDDQRVAEVLSVLKDIGVILYSEKGNIGNKKSDDISRYKVVRPNDIVVNSMNVIIGSVGLSRYLGCLSPVYYVLTGRSPSDNPHFLNAYFQTRPFQQSLTRIGNGILAHRMRIPMELLKREPFPLPPPDEQAAIVRYLDYVDRRTRKYIRAKKKLIALLNEQKQAIVHEAVSGGFTSQLSRAERLPCLGPIPSDWKLFRAKTFLRQSCLPVSSGDEIVTCFRDGQVTLRKNRRESGFTNAIKELGFQGIRSGQLVLHSMDAFAGAIGVSDSDGKCSPEYIVCDPMSDEIVPQFYALLFRSMALRGLFIMACSSVRERAPRIRFSALGDIFFPVPTKSEQIEIVRTIQSKTSELGQKISRTRREVELVEEYRTRLIADVVTGKLDVREAAAKLPDELPDDAPQDMDLEEVEGLSDDEAPPEEVA